MDGKMVLFELLIGGFFAVACIKAHGPFNTERSMTLGEIFSLSDRLERLRRSRWQWFSMVLLLLIVRLQGRLPLVLEVMVAVQLVVFLALPVQGQTAKRLRAR